MLNPFQSLTQLSRGKMNTVVVGVGSNINPRDNIEVARKEISLETTLVSCSNFVFTKPVGCKKQDDFLNGAFLIKTRHDRNAVNKILKNIEMKLGREKTASRSGPRTIDLDVLIWNDRIIDQDVYSRQFLKDSILELIPDFKF